jgi:hypothetical protein
MCNLIQSLTNLQVEKCKKKIVDKDRHSTNNQKEVRKQEKTKKNNANTTTNQKALRTK